MNIVRPITDRRFVNWYQDDDLQFLADVLRITPSAVQSLIAEIESFKYAKCRNLRFEVADSRRDLVLDLEGTKPGLSLGALSHCETDSVILEFSAALARYCGKQAPTLLILDGTVFPFYGWFDYFSHHFLDPHNQFQTIIESLGVRHQKSNLAVA